MAQFIVEADGGSRGNPGPASFGAVLIDAASGRVIAEHGETIGIATNNVAEYRGLIAGLQLAAEYGSGSTLEVRMDSKLVIEQMAGRWKIKHPAMRPLALEAQQLAQAFERVVWTWIPRAENSRADTLVNRALDGDPVSARPAEQNDQTSLFDASEPTGTPHDTGHAWLGASGAPTTFVAVRHGVTDETVRRVFSGRTGTNPALNAEGRAQAVRAADYLLAREPVDLIVASPMRRTLDTAEIISTKLGVETVEDAGFLEADFGAWDGLTFAEAQQQWPDELSTWLADPSFPPPGGESFEVVRARVEEARRRLVDNYPGKQIVVVSHVSPIKLLVREALDVSMNVLRTLDVAPASISTATWWPDGYSSLRNFSVEP